MQREHHRAAPWCPNASPGGEPIQGGRRATGGAAADWQRRLSRPSGEELKPGHLSQLLVLHLVDVESVNAAATPI